MISVLHDEIRELAYVMQPERRPRTRAPFEGGEHHDPPKPREPAVDIDRLVQVPLAGPIPRPRYRPTSDDQRAADYRARVAKRAAAEAE